MQGATYTVIGVQPGAGGVNVNGFVSVNGARANQLDWQIDGVDKQRSGTTFRPSTGCVRDRRYYFAHGFHQRIFVATQSGSRPARAAARSSNHLRAAVMIFTFGLLLHRNEASRRTRLLCP